MRLTRSWANLTVLLALQATLTWRVLKADDEDYMSGQVESTDDIFRIVDHDEDLSVNEVITTLVGESEDVQANNEDIENLFNEIDADDADSYRNTGGSAFSHLLSTVRAGRGKTQFNAYQAAEMAKIKNVAASPSKIKEMRKELLAFYSTQKIPIEKIMRQTTGSKMIENHNAGKDYAAFFLDPSARLTNDGGLEMVEVSSDLSFIKKLVKSPFTGMLAKMLTCIRDNDCRQKMEKFSPLSDPSQARKQMIVPLFEDRSAGLCSISPSGVNCESNHYREEKELDGEATRIMNNFKLQTVPTREEVKMITTAENNGEQVRASNGRLLRRVKGKKKPKSPRGKKPKSPSKKKSPKKKKSKKPPPKWVLSADGRLKCNGYKCIKNPKYKEPEVVPAKEPGDLEDKYGKISVKQLRENLASAAAIADPNKFETLNLDGNWLIIDPNDTDEVENGYKKLFCMMPNLKKISLAATNIRGVFPSNAFECLTKVEEVNMAENGLFCAAGTFDHLFESKTLTSINFHYNPMQARCYFKAKERSRKKYLYVAEPHSQETMMKKRIVKANDPEEYMRVMQECVNSEPNCISGKPALDPDWFKGSM